MFGFDHALRSKDDSCILPPTKHIPVDSLPKRKSDLNQSSLQIPMNNQNSRISSISSLRLEVKSIKLPAELLSLGVAKKMQFNFCVYVSDGFNGDIRVCSTGVSGNGQFTDWFSVDWDRSINSEKNTVEAADFDLSKLNLSNLTSNNKVFLVCVAYRFGTLKNATLDEEHSKPSISSTEEVSSFKRPVGIAIMDLMSTKSTKPTDTRFHSLRRTRQVSQTNLEMPSELSSSEGKSLSSLWDYSTSGNFTLSCLSHPVATLEEISIDSVSSLSYSSNFVPSNCCQVDISVTIFQHLPPELNGSGLQLSSISPERLDLVGYLKEFLAKSHIQILEGVMPKQGNSKKTNAQVDVYLMRQRNGATVSSPLFSSSVYDSTDRPVWNESFTVKMDEDDKENELHLLFSVRMRYAKVENDRKADKDYYFAFLPLTWRTKNDKLLVALPDDMPIALAIYRFMHSRENGFPSFNLYHNAEYRYEAIARKYYNADKPPMHTMISTEGLNGKNAFVPQAISQAQLMSKHVTAHVKISESLEFCGKSYLIVQNKFFSSTLAQAESLAFFLSIDLKETREIIMGKTRFLASVFQTLDIESWINLLFPCLDKVFELLTYFTLRNNKEHMELLFDNLITIFTLLLRSKTNDGRSQKPLLYLSTCFNAPNVFNSLASGLYKRLAHPVQPIELIVLITKYAIASYQQWSSLFRLKVNARDSYSAEVKSKFLTKINEIGKIVMKNSVTDTMTRQKCLPEYLELMAELISNRKKLYEIVTSDVIVPTWSEKELLDFYRVMAKFHLGNTEGKSLLLPMILEKSCSILDNYSRNCSSTPSINSNNFQIAYLALMVLLETVKNKGFENESKNDLFLPVFRFCLRLCCLFTEQPDSHLLAMNVVLSSASLLGAGSYQSYFISTCHPLENIDFINEVLISIEKILSNEDLEKNESSIIYNRNLIFLDHVLKFISSFLTGETDRRYDAARNQFVKTTLFFILKLQPGQKMFHMHRFNQHFGDLRLTCAKLLLQFWQHLEKSTKTIILKSFFLQNSSLIQVALNPNQEIRQISCSLLCDILILDFEHCYFTLQRRSLDRLEMGPSITLFLQGIDYLVLKCPESSKEFHQDFVDTWKNLSISPGNADFASFITSQINLLLATLNAQLLFLDDYVLACSKVPQSHITELTCLHRLILFYETNDLSVPYVTHLTTIYQRQLARRMFAEAAFALEKLSKMVSWSDDKLSNVLQNLQVCRNATTCRQFKESLYEQACELYQEDGLYEKAMELYRELMEQHMKRTFNFTKLAAVHENLASLANKIASELRQSPNFFWVSFVGNPQSVLPCLQNTSFIFRAPMHQMIGDFAAQFKTAFPDVPIKHEPPPDLKFFAESTSAIHIVIAFPNTSELVEA